MKILISRSATDAPLKLRINNPGGRWLKEEQQYNESEGLNRHGAPTRFGAITGTWSRPALLPVAVLVHFKGLSGEQKNVRADSLTWLMGYMGKHGRLPPMDDGDPRDYVPFITVYQDGTPWVSEGNHRILAAHKLGYLYLPVEIYYHAGAEGVKGPLEPALVQRYDRNAHKAGYSLKNYGPRS